MEPLSITRGERARVIAASAAGTVFEWYDFYLYAVLAPFFATLFFPPGNETASLLAAFAAYAAGFIVRPFGALVLGRLGDIAGRKYTFLISIVIMGFATFTIGLLPTFEQAGWLAPILLLALRLLQGFALGGEYGGAVIYVAEYHRSNRRGYATSWIQITATLGLFLALIVIGVCRWNISAANFLLWGWRIPFLLSAILLALSVYIRISLRETPVFLRMKTEGTLSNGPLRDSFLRWPNNKFVLFSLFGATAGQGVIWYTAQIYTLLFLTMTLRLDYSSAYLLTGAALAAGTPFFIFFGWLSDRIGRLKIILAGCLLAALTYFPLFHLLSTAINPALMDFKAANPVTLRVDASTCHPHIFIGPWSNFSLCDQVSDFFTKSGLSFTRINAPGSKSAVISVGDHSVEIAKKNEGQSALERLLFAAGYPGLTWKYADGQQEQATQGNPAFERKSADTSRIDYVTAFSILFVLMLYVTMTYGPIAAFLVELFPPQVRYTSLSFPYHIGNGVFGGMLPLLATAIVTATGDIFAWLWYPVSVASATCLIGALALRNRRKLP